MMSYDLYVTPPSAPCRAVLMLLKELGIKVNIKDLDLWRGEHMTPEFLKLNPQHMVPTLVDKDDDFSLPESHAIMKYLVDKESPDHTLYPKDLKVRATIDRWLDFDMGSLLPLVQGIVRPLFWKADPVDQEKLSALKEKLQHLDDHLKEKKYIVSENKTIVDLSILAAIVMMSIIPEFSDVRQTLLSDFEHIVKWFDTMRQEVKDYKAINEECMEGYRKILRSKQTVAAFLSTSEE